MKLLVFGMDGNLLDNYYIKSTCAGRSMSENLYKYFGINQSVEYFAQKYIETSGINSLKQFEYAYRSINPQLQINEELLNSTEKDYRKYLEEAEKGVRLYIDAQQFLEQEKGNYIFAITTTVPIDKLTAIVKTTGLDKYIEVICARGGAWNKGIVELIEGFDKGPMHYKYLIDRFNINKENIFTVSSTKADIQNAKGFGLLAVAIGHVLSEEELKSLKPQYILKDFSLLTDLLKNNK